jgi:hypothetical protein
MNVARIEIIDLRCVIVLCFLFLGFTGTASAIPELLRQCQTSDDCKAVEGICGGWMPTSRKYANDVRQEMRRQAAAASCAVSQPTPPPKTSCRQSLCVVDSEPIATAKNSPCPKPPVTKGLQNDALRQVAERLSWPIAYSQSAALEDLLRFGSQATPVLPSLEHLWNRSVANNGSCDRSASCNLGCQDFRLGVINVLEAIGAEAPLLITVVDHYQAKEKVRSHSDLEKRILSYFLKMGPAAAPAGPAVLRDLRDSRSGSGHRDLLIRILANLNTMKQDSVPVLERIAADPRDMQNKEALAALRQLGAEKKLMSELTVKTLEGPNEYGWAVPEVMRALPGSCMNRVRCVQLLSAMADGGTYSLAAVDALGRFGKDALPAVAQILRRYHDKVGFSDGSRFWDSPTTAKAALLRIDPDCQSLLPYLRPLTEDAHRVRDVVELLEACQGDEARALGAETKKRWRLR